MPGFGKTLFVEIYARAFELPALGSIGFRRERHSDASPKWAKRLAVQRSMVCFLSGDLQARDYPVFVFVHEWISEQ
jgi:hypothetical protein